MPTTNVVAEEDGEKGRDEVVHALHVAAARVADGPDVEHTLEHALHDGLVEGRLGGRGARHVNLDLVERRLVVRAVVPPGKVLLDKAKVLGALALQRRLAPLRVGRRVPAEQLHAEGDRETG